MLSMVGFSDLPSGCNPFTLPPAGGRGGGKGGRGGKLLSFPPLFLFSYFLSGVILDLLTEQFVRIVFIYIIMHKVIPMITKKREHRVFGLLCVGCGELHYITERCRRSDSCERCNGLWVRNLYRQFFHRWRQIDVVGDVVLWTLGTSLVDSTANRRRLQRHWHLPLQP